MNKNKCYRIVQKFDKDCDRLVFIVQYKYHLFNRPLFWINVPEFYDEDNVRQYNFSFNEFDAKTLLHKFKGPHYKRRPPGMVIDNKIVYSEGDCK